MHAGGDRYVHTGNFGRCDGYVAQGFMQLGRSAEPAGRNILHAIDIDIGFEKPVVEDSSPDTAVERSLHHVENIRETHAELDRHGNIHRPRNGLYDTEVTRLYLRRCLRLVIGHEENVQLQSVCTGTRYLSGILHPFAFAHAVNAGNDGKVGLSLDLRYQVDKPFHIIGPEISMEVIGRLRRVVAITRHHGRFAGYLLLENGFQHHRTDAVAGKLLDVSGRCRQRRTACYQGVLQPEPHVFYRKVCHNRYRLFISYNPAQNV